MEDEGLACMLKQDETCSHIFLSDINKEFPTSDKHLCVEWAS